MAGEEATILIIDDKKEHAELTAECLERVGYECHVASSGAEGLRYLRSGHYDVVITDLRMDGVNGMDLLREAKSLIPDVQVIVITGYGTIRTAVQALQEGAVTYLTKPVDKDELRTVVEKAVWNQRISRSHAELVREVDKKFGFGDIIGKSKPIRDVFETIRRVAPTKATVLITGESGSGKELVARAIHQGSPRHMEPFVVVNCASLPETMVESELFGHEKGAFTGALERRKGRFEFAHRGTLFLDEIGDMELSTQTRLLRAIEHKEITRLGSNEPIKVDVRVIAATNQDIEELVHRGKFRQDLYFRLNVVRIHVPPLRERREDIPLLVESFIRELSTEHGKNIAGITPEALSILKRYDWPGNVRQLRNCIESMIVVAQDSVLDVTDLPNEIVPSESGDSELLLEPGMSLQDAERELIKKTLDMVNGNREEAAKILGIGERTLYRKIRKYNLR